MGAMDNMATARKDAARGGGPSARERMAAAARPTPEALGDAWLVIEEEVGRRLDADPRNGPPKISVAKMAQGDWCVSITNWNTGFGLSRFSADLWEAMTKLATSIARGEEWKPLPVRK